MFARNPQEINPVLFPKEWSQELKQILLNIYGQHCITEEKTFEVFGFSYPNEVLLIVSFVGIDKFVTPVSFFVSSDLTNIEDPKKLMGILFDSVGVFFDSYFQEINLLKDNPDEIWDQYIFDWEEFEFSSKKLFYKITRENIALTMEAELLLNSKLN